MKKSNKLQLAKNFESKLNILLFYKNRFLDDLIKSTINLKLNNSFSYLVFVSS